MKKLLILMLSLLFLKADTYVVDDSYSAGGYPACESGDHTYDNITDAISDANGNWSNTPHTIRICPGSYGESNIAITNQNIAFIESTTGDRDDVIVQASSNQPIFKITGFTSNLTIKDLTIKQNKNNITAFKSSVYISGFTLDNVYIYSAGLGFYESNSIGDSTFKNLLIDSKKEALYLKGINNKINLVDVNLTARDNYSAFRTTNWGDINISKNTLSYNYFEGGSHAIDIEQGNLDISDSYLVTDGSRTSGDEGDALYIRSGNTVNANNLNITSIADGINIPNGTGTLKDLYIVAQENGIRLTSTNAFDITSSSSNYIEAGYTSGTKGIYLETQTSGVTTIEKSNIKIGNSSNIGIDVVDMRNILYIKDNNISGGDYSIYIRNATSAGELLRNNFENFSTRSLQLLTSSKWVGFKVYGNCFYSDSVINYDNSIAFDDGSKGNYWGACTDSDGDGVCDTSKTGIPALNKEDRYPLSNCPFVGEDVIRVLEYRFDECSDYNSTTDEVKDSSANNYHATAVTLVGTETNDSVGGGIYNVAEFNNSNYIESSYIYSYLKKSMTLSFWIKTTQVGNDTAYLAPGITGVEQASGVDDIFLGWIDASGHIGIQKGDTTGAKSSTAINDDNWHHIVLTRDSVSGEVKVYVDGTLEDTKTSATGVVGNSFNRIGSIYDMAGTHTYFTGYLDEFKIFNGVLDDGNVSAIYNNELNKKNYDGSVRTEVNCDTYEVCYYETFATPLDANWTIIKQENFTPQTLNGRLRLTSNSGNVASGLNLSQKVFKASDTKFRIKFRHYAYDGSSSKGADGITLVFSDANITPVAGAYGGSLGYAQRDDTTPATAGFAGGWFGVGIDEYGNYSNPTEGRVGGIGFTPHAVAIRGSHLENYLFLVSSGTLTPNISDGSSSTPSPGYQYRMDVDTTTLNRTKISIYRDTGSGWEIIIDGYEYNTTNTPDYFRFSITGSTGGETNIHEIDDLEVSALSCVTTFVDADEINATQRVYNFDVRDTWRSLSDRNISTKTVNKSFDLTLSSLDENSSLQDFNGTVCLKVTSSDGDKTSYIKSLFSNEQEKNVTFNVALATKNSLVNIRWKENVNSNCPLSDFNETNSSDNFAVIPKELNISLDGTLVSAKDYNITIKAYDYTGALTTDYNQTIFNYSYKKLMPSGDENSSLNGTFTMSDFNVTDGDGVATINFNDVGKVKFDINDTNFAVIDSDDTSESNRTIYSNILTNTFIPYKFDVSKANIKDFNQDSHFTYLANSLDYMYASIDANITALNFILGITQNYDKDLYAKTLTLDMNISKNGLNSNDENSSFNFEDGKAEVTFKFNFGKDEKVNPFNISKSDDINISIKDSDCVTGELNSANVDGNATFYYSKLLYKDVTTEDIDSNNSSEVYVYNSDESLESNSNFKRNSIDWYANLKHSAKDGNITLVVAKSDYNISSSDTGINLTQEDLNMTINNPSKKEYSVIHIKSSDWLWYSPYGDNYDDSVDSDCKTHYCFEYYYTDITKETLDVGSGSFKGADVNITSPKKRVGVKVYR